MQVLDFQYLSSYRNSELHTPTATTATLASRDWGALGTAWLCPSFTLEYAGNVVQVTRECVLGPLFEKVFMHCDFRDRSQEIWFDPFVEPAVPEIMCFRNSYCSLNCVQLPAALLQC